MQSIPRALFHGFFLAAVSLGTVEAIHVAINGSDALSAFDRLLTAVYVTTPYTLFGGLLAVTTAGLTGLWVKAKQVKLQKGRTVSPVVDIMTGLCTFVAFAASLFIAARLILATFPRRDVGAPVLAIATPIALVFAVYIWAILRRQFARMEAGLGYWQTLGILCLLVGIGLLVPVLAVLRNDALAELLGGWTALFAIAYPTLTLLYALIFHFWSPSFLVGQGARRTALGLSLLSAGGLADLILHMDARPPVKAALLHDTLVFEPLVVLTQPLFDNDGDGYAPVLGGGDCDDTNENVHPGAVEIARNGLDDDCYGGDSPGSQAPREITPPPRQTAAVRGLVQTPNIIMVTIDTLRNDHLGFMGYERPTSPFLDELAGGGLRFKWAFAQGPQTRVSVPSTFSGRYYSELQRTPDIWARIHPENVLLAERLRQEGYNTAGIPSHRFFLPNYGLDQGFEHWDLSIVQRYQTRTPKVVTGSQVSDRALDWLQKRKLNDGAFYLWLHYFDPHHIYMNHDEVDFGDTELDRYDEEIRYTDSQLGRVLSWIANSAFADSTYVIVHSDHSEAFGMHGYKRHGQHLFNDQVRVPLIVAGPGLRSRQVDTPVSMLDIVPTVLDLAGIEIPGDLTGVSLLPYGTEMEPPPHPPVFVEMLKDPTHSDRRAIIDWPWKLQYGITFDEYTLFDLSQDPNEQRELSKQRPKEFLRLQNKLRVWMAEGVQPVVPRR